MDKTVNGHITLDTYLVFDKADITSENRSLVGKEIDADEYIYRFHRDLWSTSDNHAQAHRDLKKYVDALNEYVKDTIEQMFDSCTLGANKLSHTSDIVVFSDGVAGTCLTSTVWFNGMNPHLPIDELEAEIKKRIDNRHSGGLAGIAQELIEIYYDVYVSQKGATK